MKKITTLVFSLSLILATKAQVEVANEGNLNITTTAGAWGSALRSHVSNNQTCAYHLRLQGTGDVFYVSAQGWLWAQSGGFFGSDMKLKSDVEEVENALDGINKLNGIKFHYIQKDSLGNILPVNKEIEGKRIGVSAQDVQKVYPGLVKELPDGTLAVAYTDLIGVLIEGVKEQQIQINNLQYRLNKQEANTESLTKSGELEAIQAAHLNQNFPNPFSEETEISYFVPETANTSSIMIFDLSGKLLKTFDGLEKGNGAITLAAQNLDAGMYVYSLIVNGVEMDNKRFILTDK